MESIKTLIEFVNNNRELFITLLGSILAIIKLTAWGKAKAEALDTVIAVIERAGANVVKSGVAAKEALKFFAWAYKSGDKMAEDLDYVPMPDKVVSAIEDVWKKEIKDDSGKPIY